VKLLLGRVAFREDVVVIEKIERLGKLDGALGDEGGLFCFACASLD
jgi:hypothetical protein